MALTIAVEMILVLRSGVFLEASERYAAVRHGADYSNTEALGELLYTQYLYPWKWQPLILLVAIIAAIVLTLRRHEQQESQNIGKQVQVRREDRVRLVKMEAQMIALWHRIIWWWPPSCLPSASPACS
ncbi:MAG: hypothetical protein R3E95_17415 [Thiolinea sp.]